MSELDKKTTKEIILSQIEKGEALMKPRWHFVLRSALLILGIIIVALLVVELVSFAIFALRQNGVFFAPGFGMRGFGTFMLSLPWLIILLSLVFMLVLEVLVKRYAFSYQRPVVYSVFVIVVFVSLGSILVHASKMHEAIFVRARDRGMPVVGPVYRAYGLKEKKDIHPGVIYELTEYGFFIRNRRGDNYDIYLSERTRYPQGMILENGDHVVVFGECCYEENKIDAWGVREIEPGRVRFGEHPRLIQNSVFEMK